MAEKLPALADGGLWIVALGGLEIGRNMTVFECDGQLLIVDCGVLFPDEAQPGVDLILPDFDYLRDRLMTSWRWFSPTGMKTTSAVTFLLRERPDIPIYGSKLTLAFPGEAARATAEAPLQVVGRVTRNGWVLSRGRVPGGEPLTPMRLLCASTPPPGGSSTGDFKMDQLPLDGRITDLTAMGRLGSEGVDLLLVDSTNAEVSGFVKSESEILPALEQVMASTQKRVIVASFASHVHRIQQVIDVATEHGRKIAPWAVPWSAT